MKYYLAARYSRHAEMRGYRGDLEKLGHPVTSRWIDIHGGKWPTSMSPEYIYAHVDEASEVANIDLEDIDACTVLIAFTEEGYSTSKGGRHVEFGYALAQGKSIIIIGPRENVFYGIPAIQYDSWEDFIKKVPWNEVSAC